MVAPSWRRQDSADIGRHAELLRAHCGAILQHTQMAAADPPDPVSRRKKQTVAVQNMFRQQQKLFQQARIVQNQRLKSIKQLYEQFLKSMHELEKNHETLLTSAQNELRKEMAMLQKKILMDTQQQEMASVRKSLQSMLF